MNKSIAYLICLVILLFVVVTGCGPQEESQVIPHARYVESYDGVRVAVPEHPKRILALSSASDTILLGLVEPNRLVGINKLSTYEEYSLEAKRAKLVKPVMSSYPLEKIIALDPDLVIAPDYTSADVIEGLRHMGIPTVVVPTGTTVESVIKNVTDIAHIVGEDEKGQFYEQKIRRELEKMKRLGTSIPLNQRKSVLFVSSMDGYTGTGSLFDDMCKYMSIYNAPDLLGLPPRTPFGDERVLAMDPDYIFIPSYKGMDKNLASRYLDNPAFQNLPAIKEHRVKPLPAAYLYTMNQHIGEAMLAIMHTVYPQLERNPHD
ncbi:MAG: ABC transporter substrate-binding protein [Veillonella sp.]|uniref:ABC transporter substrate-binding protein n=1 Tax=Veillonella sp. TaxID=1926307 RepID=UPI0029158114|nr:ABC transporter substrate-binding protein [Veillonella sp.]MDU5733256.1 ABC transporter substrate-binding protein [Veillonella sp.]